MQGALTAAGGAAGMTEFSAFALLLGGLPVREQQVAGWSRCLRAEVRLPFPEEAVALSQIFPAMEEAGWSSTWTEDSMGWLRDRALVSGISCRAQGSSMHLASMFVDVVRSTVPASRDSLLLVLEPLLAHLGRGALVPLLERLRGAGSAAGIARVGDGGRSRVLGLRLALARLTLLAGALVKRTRFKVPLNWPVAPGLGRGAVPRRTYVGVTESSVVERKPVIRCSAVETQPDVVLVPERRRGRFLMVAEGVYTYKYLSPEDTAEETEEMQRRSLRDCESDIGGVQWRQEFRRLSSNTIDSSSPKRVAALKRLRSGDGEGFTTEDRLGIEQETNASLDSESEEERRDDVLLNIMRTATAEALATSYWESDSQSSEEESETDEEEEDDCDDGELEDVSTQCRTEKRLRFSLKNNLSWTPTISPVPPLSLRTPAACRPRGSALKPSSSFPDAGAAEAPDESTLPTRGTSQKRKRKTKPQGPQESTLPNKKRKTKPLAPQESTPPTKKSKTEPQAPQELTPPNKRKTKPQAPQESTPPNKKRKTQSETNAVSTRTYRGRASKSSIVSTLPNRNKSSKGSSVSTPLKGMRRKFKGIMRRIT